MTGTNNDLDRVRLHYTPPLDAYERLMKERGHRRAISRISAAAFAVALAVGALGVLFFAFRGPHEGTHPASGPGVRAVSDLQGRVVFERSTDGQRNLFIANLDGSSASQVTTGSNDQAGDLSPDGTKIVYASEPQSGAAGIAVINVDGSGRTQLTTGSDYVPSWSPDGSQIVFARGGIDNIMSIFVMNADGSGVQGLTVGFRNGVVNDYLPSWSFDGTTILFQRVTQARTALWEMNADGSNEHPVISDASDPQWSPDGTQIAFVREGNVWVRNASGTTPARQATDFSSADAGSLAWSADGAMLAFSHSDGVWVVNADGTGLLETSLPHGASPTSWGRSVAG